MKHAHQIKYYRELPVEQRSFESGSMSALWVIGAAIATIVLAMVIGGMYA